MKNKMIFGLLSVVIAFGLWVYVVTVVSPESEATFYNVPVILSNESVLSEKGLMIVTDSNPTITLRLSGNRSDLNSLKTSDITVIADLSNINEGGQQTLDYDISYPGGFASNAFETLSRNPDRITVEIVEWSTKEVDIEVKYTGSVPTDYIDYRSSAEVEHEKVTITGPKSVIDQIDKAMIYVDLSDRTETFSQNYRYTLVDKTETPVDAAQVKTNVSEVSVSVKIQRVKEIKLQLDVTYGAGATADTTSILIDPQIIRVSGSEKLLENLEENLINGDTLVIGKVDLTAVTESKLERTYPISLPEGITNLTGVNEVKVTIEFPDMAINILDVSALEAVNLPEGLTAEFITQKIPVTLRGASAQIKSIQAEDIIVRVDFTGAELGFNNYQAVVTVSSEFDGVSVVGTYEVVANVKEIAEEAV